VPSERSQWCVDFEGPQGREQPPWGLVAPSGQWFGVLSQGGHGQKYTASALPDQTKSLAGMPARLGENPSKQECNTSAATVSGQWPCICRCKRRAEPRSTNAKAPAAGVGDRGRPRRVLGVGGRDGDTTIRTLSRLRVSFAVTFLHARDHCCGARINLPIDVTDRRTYGVPSPQSGAGPVRFNYMILLI
jgi:hypothetical protein